jgi:hypothetical protein
MQYLLEVGRYSGRILFFALVAAAIIALALLFTERKIQAETSAGSSSGHYDIANKTKINDSGPVYEESPANAEGSSDTAPSSSRSIRFNGQEIPLPENGSSTKTITDGGSTTTINAQSSTSSEKTEALSSNSSHTSLIINSHSSSVSIGEGADE